MDNPERWVVEVLGERDGALLVSRKGEHLTIRWEGIANWTPIEEIDDVPAAILSRLPVFRVLVGVPCGKPPVGVIGPLSEGGEPSSTE
jgi:hypothetical protein